MFPHNLCLKTQVCSCYFLFKILQWLPTPLRIKFKILNTCHKVMHGLVPTTSCPCLLGQCSKHTQLLSFPETLSFFLPQGVCSHYFCGLNSSPGLSSDLYLANSCLTLQWLAQGDLTWSPSHVLAFPIIHCQWTLSLRVFSTIGLKCYLCNYWLNVCLPASDCKCMRAGV